MASTNKTSHYELSQFVGSDIPAWLVDYNGDMSKIDTGIAQAKTTADTAGQTADTAIANAQNAQETANTAVTNAAAAQATATGADTKIGDLAELTTVDKTSVVGAVNELKEDLTDVEGAINTLVVDSLEGSETDKAPSVNSTKSYVTGRINNLKGVNLYSNSTGTNGNITLSDNIENYSKIGVIFKQAQGYSDYAEVDTAISTKMSLTISYAVNNNLYIDQKAITLNGNQITVNSYAEISISSGSTGYFNQNNIKIIEVIGYKE